MQKFYSLSTKGFYSVEFHGSGIPADAVEVSDEQYEAVVAGHAHIRLDEFNTPTLVAATPVTLSYAELRAMEYPPIADYLDGVVKNDQMQINKYIADCQAVKAKYPKPESN